MRGSIRSEAWAWGCAWMLSIGVGVGCKPTASTSAQCPACECQCACDQATTSPTSGAAAGSGAVDVDELVASASRKLNHEDGQGCLEDLDAIAARDPKMDERLAMSRAQCEMLVGRCQEGKKRISKWLEVEMAMTGARALQTIDGMAAMRCRGGNSTDRDKVLRAQLELTDGAYSSRRSSRWCAERINVLRSLGPRVKPRDEDDFQVENATRNLHMLGANCHARAGECRAAWAVFRDLHPPLSHVTDPAKRSEIIRSSFDSLVSRCKDAV